MFYYFAYNLNIVSELELPILNRKLNIDNSKGTVYIKKKNKISNLYSPKGNNFNLENAVIHRKYIGYFLIENGEHIFFEKDGDPSKGDISRVILHQVFARVLFQRRLICFHASALSINSKTILFSGISGMGKSSLCAKLIGFEEKNFISEDLTPIVEEENKYLAVPTFPFIKLDQTNKKEKFDLVRKINFDNERLSRDGYIIKEESMKDSLSEISSIIFLAWGKENNIKKLSSSEAFHRSLPNLFKPSINQENMESLKFLYDHLENLIHRVNFFVFERKKIFSEIDNQIDYLVKRIEEI